MTLALHQHNVPMACQSSSSTEKIGKAPSSEDELCTEIKQKTEETQSAKKNMSDAHIKELLGVLASKGIIDVGMITACSVEK